LAKIFGAGAVGEYSEYVKDLRVFGYGKPVYDGEVAEDCPVGVLKGYSQVAYSLEIGERLSELGVPLKPFEQLVPDVYEPFLLDDQLASGARDGILEALDPAAPEIERYRTEALRVFEIFGDPRAVCVEDFGKIFDERIEERLPDFGGGAFEN